MARDGSSRISEHVSLAPLERALHGFRPPGAVFDPRGAWSASFTAYSLATRPSAVGSVRLERRPQAGGDVHFAVESSLACGMGVQFLTSAEVRCSGDGVATPSFWEVRTRQVGTDGQTLPDSQGALRGGYDGRRLSVDSCGVTRTREVPSALAWNWGLFDVVQRLAPEATPAAAEFALLDHFDQVKRGHTLRLRKRCRLRLGTEYVPGEERIELDKGTVFRPTTVERGGADTDCVVFEQVGRGILPIVYWCTVSGRLLIVSSGLEAYVLASGDESR